MLNLKISADVGSRIYEMEIEVTESCEFEDFEDFIMSNFSDHYPLTLDLEFKDLKIECVDSEEAFFEVLFDDQDYDSLAAIAVLLSDSVEVDPIKAYYENHNDVDSDYFQESYQGNFGSMKDYAEHCIEEGLYGDIPDTIKYHIDYESLASELKYDYCEINGHIFRAV